MKSMPLNFLGDSISFGCSEVLFMKSRVQIPVWSIESAQTPGWLTFVYALDQLPLLLFAYEVFE